MNAERDPSVERVSLKGHYSPANFFEEPVRMERPEHTLTLSDGKIEITLNLADPLPTADEQNAIAREVENLFHSQMVLSTQNCEWSPLTLTRDNVDGTRDLWPSTTGGISISSVRSPDILLADKDGNAIRDSRVDRLSHQREFREKCLEHAGDAVLIKLLSSYAEAVKDKDDMFVHLYEIREAIKKQFGNENDACSALGISNSEWGAFGKLTNREPVAESRHRGGHTALRPSTEEERSQATSFARKVIENYLNHKQKE